MITKLNASNFDAEVTNENKSVLVDFWAEWCGPCRMLAPVIDEIDKEYADKYKICKVNVDEAPDLAGRFGISSIPTLLIIKGGKITGTLIGVQPKESIIAQLEK